MARVNDRPLGQLSRIIELAPPPGAPPVPVDDAFEDLRTTLQRDWNRLLITDRDTLTTAVATFDYLSNGEVHQFHAYLPLGESLLRSTNLATIDHAVDALRANLAIKLEDARLRGMDAQIIGVRGMRVFIVSSAAALERRAMAGNAHKNVPKELANKHCCVNIQTTTISAWPDASWPTRCGRPTGFLIIRNA